MDVQVDIPVIPMNSHAGADQQDEAGGYWIGSEGRARLYFCRILPNKIVMVRIGGGWVDLSK